MNEPTKTIEYTIDKAIKDARTEGKPFVAIFGTKGNIVGGLHIPKEGNYDIRELVQPGFSSLMNLMSQYIPQEQMIECLGLLYQTYNQEKAMRPSDYGIPDPWNGKNISDEEVDKLFK